MCALPEREAADRAIVAGEPKRRIASRFGLSEAAVRRHEAAGHVAAAVAKASEAAEIVTADNLLEQARQLQQHALDVLTLAKGKKPDLRAANGAIRETCRVLELMGKLQGILTPGGAVAIALAGPPPADPSPAEIKWAKAVHEAAIAKLEATP